MAASGYRNPHGSMKQKGKIAWKSLGLRVLRLLAGKLGIRGRSAMTKPQLVRELEKVTRASAKARAQALAAVKALERQATSKPTAPPPPPPPPPPPAEPYVDRGKPIPDTYGRDTLRLMARDPEWVFAYWELTPERIQQLRSRFSNLHERTWELKLTNLKTGEVEHIAIFLGACNWYLHVKPRGVYQAELGFRDGGLFIKVLDSNPVRTPADAISERADEEWMVMRRDLLRMLHLTHERELFGEDRPLASAERYKEVTQEQLEVLRRAEREARELGASGGVPSSRRKR